MESLWLVALLFVIVLVGYAVVNVMFKIMGDALTFFGENRLLVLLVLATILAVWLGYHP